MKNQKCRFISVIITFLILMSVMCFDNVIEAAISSDISAKNPDFCFETVASVIEDTQTNSDNVFYIHKNINSGQLAVQFAKHRRDNKILLDFLCENIFCGNERKFYAGFDNIENLSNNTDKLVINYIHKSDGKKRII